MDEQKYIITFENGSVADANRWASELKEYILDATSDVEVEQRRDNPYSQDIGAMLSLVLGAPAVIAVAKALGQWLALHRQAGITIKTPHGEIIATNLTSEDIMKLAELMLAQKE
jgi:hypothetical protein